MNPLFLVLIDPGTLMAHFDARLEYYRNELKEDKISKEFYEGTLHTHSWLNSLLLKNSNTKK